MAWWLIVPVLNSKLFQSKQVPIPESMSKCRIRIPVEILLLGDQKISNIEPETAELALFVFNRSLVRSFGLSISFRKDLSLTNRCYCGTYMRPRDF